jgi:SAM-dependent methyltransferase
MAHMLASKGGYSLENAQRFAWASVVTALPDFRVEMLNKYVFGSKVLDAGCGGGGFVDYLTRTGHDAVGVDNFEDFLQLATKNRLLGRFIKADLTERLPFDDKVFDTTICFDVLEHVDDGVAIAELARVTQRRLIVTVPRDDTSLLRYGLAAAPYVDNTHLRYYTEESLTALASTVSPVNIAILDEGVIDLRSAALDLLLVKSRFPGMTSIYARLLKFLLRRSSAPGLYVNFAAIIDLDES